MEWISSEYEGGAALDSALASARPEVATLDRALRFFEAPDPAEGTGDLDLAWLAPANWFWSDLVQSSADPEACYVELQAVEAFARLRALLSARSDLAGYAAQGEGVWISAWLETGQYARAEGLVRECLDVYRETREARLSMLALLADCLRLREKWSEASACLADLEAEFAATPPDPASWLELEVYAMTLGVRVQVETMLGRLGQALDTSEREQAAAQAYWDAFPEPDGRASDALIAAWVRRNELMLMRDQHQELIERLAVATYPGTDARRLYALGKAHAAYAFSDPTHIAVARQNLLAARALSEGAGTQPGTDELNALWQVYIDVSLVQMAALEGDLPAMRAALDELAVRTQQAGSGEPMLRLHSIQAALEAEWTRRQVAGASAAGQAAFETLQRSALDLAAARRSGPLVPGGLGDLNDVHRREVLAELLLTGASLDRLEEAVLALFELQSAGSLARSLQASTPSLQAVRSELLGAGGLVMWVPTQARTVLLTIDAGELRVFELAGEDRLRKTVLELDREAHFSGPAGSPRLRALAEKLRDALLPAEVQTHLGSWSHVYWSGTEFLLHPPMESLPMPGAPAEGRQFGTQLAMAYLPSIPLAVQLARSTRAPESGDRLAIVAGPIEASAERTSLAFGEPVWRAFAEPFEKGALDLHWGADANATTLFETDWSDARVLNVLCHGVFDAERLLPAGLALPGGPESAVWWADLVQMQAPDLVVLSACGAARGPKRLGEDGTAHLGGAFLTAGAKSVLLSRGDLEVESTLAFNRAFHQALAAGASPMVALRDARAAVAGASQNNAYAGLLSQLFLLGPAHKPLFVPHTGAAPESRWAWIVGLSLLAGIGAFALGKRRAA